MNERMYEVRMGRGKVLVQGGQGDARAVLAMLREWCANNGHANGYFVELE